jgi:hypothetical protein
MIRRLKSDTNVVPLFVLKRQVFILSSPAEGPDSDASLKYELCKKEKKRAG